MKNIAIIPSRGGSKRIPNKNIKHLDSKPIIGHVIEKLLHSGRFEEVIVSTDSKEIGEISKAFGAKIPFERPGEISNDSATTQAVIRHAIISLGIQSTLVTCVYPTSVLIEKEDILKAEDVHTFRSEVDFVIAAYQPNSSPLRSFTLNSNEGIKMLFPQYYDSRSQDLPSVFADAGLFYMASTDKWLNCEGIFTQNSFIVEVPRTRAVDINSTEDWELLELSYFRNKQNTVNGKD